ncbi:Putative esterase [Caulifigura coniformis]|uniref:Esterase n=1 Tax=Caulifigura coniformis TaxID=2527983 RepID=A0A517S9R2_9PLAN|nr:alpha/beta hydrolase-fold protein [Caulifigura coniformis]QDT52864.1 Putative esterase [Caulifigura coniformis]
MAVRCVLLLALAIACTGCGGPPSGEQPFLTRTYRTADGSTAHYVLFVPPNRDPAEKLPVILFLNGWGENGNDGLRQISNNFGGDMWRMRAWFPFLAVCPQCTYNAEWTPGSKNAELALGVLDEAIREFNGDPDRVSLTGASTGGTGALNIAVANPDRFAAAFPISTAIHISPQAIPGRPLPIWNFFNAGDSSILVREARTARKRQYEAGMSPLVTEFNQGGHNAWDAAYSSPALYEWLLQQKRGQSDPFAPYRFLAPQKGIAEWTSEEGSHWLADGDEFIAPPGDSRRELTSPAFTGDWAVHVDAQLGPGHAATVALRDAQGGRAELGLVLSSDGFAELTSSGKAAVTIDATAQRALRRGWNDIRLQSSQGRLSVLLNGWRALTDVDLPLAWPVRLSLVKPAGDVRTRFRFLRVSGAMEGANR